MNSFTKFTKKPGI